MHSNKNSVSITQYLHRLSGQEKEPLTVDHNYVKNWNAHPDSQRTKPARMLFMNPMIRSKRIDPNEEIDVVTPEIISSNVSPFSNQKSRNLLNELERSLRCHPKINCNRVERKDILKDTSPQQRRIYYSVMEVLNSEILAISAYSGKPNEIIKKRIATEKFSQHLKTVFANNFWDFDHIMWMHQLVLDELSFCYLLSYLRLLQLVRSEIPDLVDQIIRRYSGCLGYDYICQLLKKDCDPVFPVLNQLKPKKLSNSPFLLISCAGFDAKNVDQASRMHFWTAQLNTFCKTIYVPVSEHKFKLKSALNFMKFALSSMKQKISQLKNHFPNRPIILGGWTIGALIACHVALDMPVDAVVCFGFPLLGVNGSRGDLDDPLLTSCKPILFIVGQNATMSSTDDIEDFRSRMLSETSLVVVGGADDFLRITPIKMQKECITQAMVDRCILDEVADFLQATLVKLPPPNVVSTNTFNSCPTIWEENSDDYSLEKGKKKRKRKAKQFSPKVSTSNKRKRYSLPKKKKATPKAGRSASSSETSSSGSTKKRKKTSRKPAKKTPQKRRVGRPSGSTNRKNPPKIIIKPCVKSSNQSEKKSSSVKQTLDQNIQIPIIPPVKESKPPVPFALNILPKKNAPVDVEKAFGNDSSFLPRPLTPAEEIKSINETDTNLTQLETLDIAAKPQIISCLVAGTKNNNLQKSFLSLTEQPNVTVVTTKPASVMKSSFKSVISTLNRKKTSALAKSSHFKTVFHQGPKNELSNAVEYIKSMNGSENVPDSDVPTSVSKTIITNSSATKPKSIISYPIPISKSASSTNESEAIATAPSCSTSLNNPKLTLPARIIVSSTTLKVPSGKVVRLLAKAPIAVKKAIPSTQSGSLDQQSCNLSLLSDVAEMTESFNDTKKKMESIPSAATLVKLAVNEQKNMNSLKLKACHSLSKSESHADILEKQRAIQALNKNIYSETSARPARPGYSICFTKPDGSILTRTMPRVIHSPFIRQSSLSSEANKSKAKPVLFNKPQEIFYR